MTNHAIYGGEEVSFRIFLIKDKKL